MHSQSDSSVSYTLKMCRRVSTPRKVFRVISIAQTKPPCELTRFVLGNYYSFVGVRMVNFALPDPIELVVRPKNSSHVLFVAK